MPYPVFISYARKSSREYAQKLHEALGSDGGLAFLDTSDIEAGEQFPAVLVDAILGARVVVVFAEDAYFRRWYCLRELLTALDPFDTLLTRPGSSEKEKAAALAPIIVALPPAGARPKEMERFPPLLRTTDWPVAEDVERLAALVRARTAEIDITIGRRLDALGRTAAVRETLLKESLIPPPANLAGVRIVPIGISPSIGRAFVGRADDLWRIHTVLSTLRGDTSTAALTGALEGGGGFGKTRLALEYLHRFGPSSYPGGLFWVDADVDETRLEERHHSILSTLIPTTPDIVTFREQNQNASQELARALHALPPEELVLYIVDNVPEPQAGVPPQPLTTWCPAIGKVALLVTSRARIMGEQGVASLPVDILAPDAAVDLLTHDLPDRSRVTYDSWRSIAEWVGNLPLALELLNCAMQSGALSPEELLERSRSTGPSLELDGQMEILRDKVPAGSLRGVTEALSISYDKLRKDGHDDIIQQAARLMAQLSPEPIPIALLEAFGPELSSSRVRSTLISRSLVTPAPGGAVPLFGRMHRVMADFLRSKSEYPQEELRNACEALVQIMRPNACRDPMGWPLMNVCLPHAELVFARRDTGAPTAPEAFVRLGLGIGILFEAQGAAPLALSYEHTTVKIAEMFLGSEHPSTLAAMNNLAGALYAQGDLDSARDLQEQVFETSYCTLGREHPDTLGAMNNLAQTLSDLGNLTAARDLQQQVLEATCRILGSEHPGTLTAMNNLAQTLSTQGDLPGARDLQQQVLDAFQRILGNENPHTLGAMNNLAQTLSDLGNLTAARDLQQQVLEATCRILGSEHPGTLTAMNNLAQTLSAQGDLPGGRDLQQQVVEAFQRILGNENPHTLGAMNNLAGILYAQGDLSGASDLQHLVLDASRRILGLEHPATTVSAWNLFTTLQDSQERDTADVVFENHLAWLLKADPNLLAVDQAQIRQKLIDMLKQDSWQTPNGGNQPWPRN